MKKINVALVRLLQFVVFVAFTFMVLAYFGALVLMPLDAIVLMVKLLSLFGMSTLIATIIALPIVGYLGMMVYKTPDLMKLLVDIGMDLVKTAKTRVEAFNPIAESMKD